LEELAIGGGVVWRGRAGAGGGARGLEEPAIGDGVAWRGPGPGDRLGGPEGAGAGIDGGRFCLLTGTGNRLGGGRDTGVAEPWALVDGWPVNGPENGRFFDGWVAI
jgi:hypothetical protein